MMPTLRHTLAASLAARSPVRAVLVGCLALMLGGAATDARAYDVMLDVSGSMSGFERSAEWPRLLAEMQSGASGRWVFGETATPFAGNLVDAPLNRPKTLLGDALQTWVDAGAGQPRALVMLTDNVADAQSAESNRDQRQFYDLLTQRMDLEFIGITPLRLPFSGTVYHPTIPGRQSFYDGERALAVYILATPGYPLDRLERLQSDISALADGEPWPNIVVRPFAREGWDGSIQGSDINVSAQVAEAARIRANEDGILIEGYTVGDPLDFSIETVVRPGPNFRLRDVSLSTDIRFFGTEHMHAAELNDVTITPNRTDLEPERQRTFQLDYKIEGFRLTDLTFGQLLDLALRGSSVQTGEIQIEFAVERANIDFIGPIAEQWNFDGPPGLLAEPDASVQGRIFKFSDLVTEMVPEDQLRKQIWSRPVWVVVVYPVMPLLLALLAALLLVAAAIYAMRRLAKGSRYLVYDDAGTAREIAPGFAGAATVPSSDNATDLTVRNFGFFHWHSSADRLVSNRFASASRAVADVESRSDDGGGERYRFVVEKMRPNSEGQHEDDEF